MGFRLLRIAGIDVHVDWSLAIIFILLLGSLALGLFPAWHPEWGRGLTWGTALAASLAFFASVLLHELSHALVGRRHGVVIRRITLFVFGGMAHIEREPEKWRAELWMAAVGPLTSLALGAACLFWAGTFVDWSQVDLERPEPVFRSLAPFPTLMVWLGQVNLMLGLFNLVPGFPLDGGRVLRAILWAYTGSLRRATRLASGIGQAFAWLLIATGFLMILGVRVPVFGSGFAGGIWLALIGWFLNNAALMSYRQLLTREALEGVPVSRLMQTPHATVQPEVTVQELVEDHMLKSGQRGFPVLAGNRLAGMVSLEDVKKLDPRLRAATRVAEIMTPAERLSTVTPQTEADEALQTLVQRNLNQLPVLQDGRLVGIVDRENVMRWLALHASPEDEHRARRLQRA